MSYRNRSAWRIRMAWVMIMLLLAPSFSAAQAPAADKKDDAASEGEAVQPKFIWGILIKYAASKAFEVFFDWSVKKMFHGTPQPATLSRKDAVSAPGAAELASSSKSMPPIVPNVTDKAPAAPLIVTQGKENYQGVLLSLLVLQSDGEHYAVRPVSAGFKSGEKFRIRVGSTFDGDLSLDNINPQGERSRLYPADSNQVVRIRNGSTVILPLDADSYFQFDDVVGEEKLVVSLRDSRAQGAAAAQARVHRQENDQGTGLLQEVVPGKYAAIAESIALSHRQ